MPVYVDELTDWGSFWGHYKGKWCHMRADTLDELHEMAVKIGLRRSYFQNKPRHPHYDLRESKRTLAIANGAIPVSRKQMYLHFKTGENL